jgi:hypothetical protein
LNGKCHRKNGPAIIWINGTKAWFLNDKRHREDGPAVEYANGNKSWYVEGKLLDPKEAINDPELKLNYPRLVEAMIINSVHES